MIQVKNLVKRYGAFRAVADISFDVQKGEVVGFLGPNGAGKTTTIRVLTCYHPPSGGKASVAGHDVLRESMAVRQKIGYLPESAPLYPEMRVREYLAFRARLHRIPSNHRQSAIGRVTELCWLSDFICRPISQLSKGMRQRVGLAGALLHDPDVVILDEPTVGLDPSQIRATLDMIRGLSQHHTVLFSSHILPQVEQVCSRVVIINKGRILAQGSPRQLGREKVTDSRLIAEIKGPEDEIRKAILAVKGVQDIQMTLEDGWNRLSVSAKQDIRETLFSLVKEKGWALREIRHEVASLEDYYLKITSREEAVPV